MFSQDGKMTVWQLGEVKRVLDKGFLEYFQKTIDQFVLNYAGTKNYKEIYNTIGLSLESGVHLERCKDREVVGVAYLHDDSWYQVRRDEPKPSRINICPSHKFSLEIPRNEQPFLPSRLVKHYIGLYSALANAVNGVTVAPTRFIPSNKDTLLALEKHTISDAVEKRLQEKGFNYNGFDYCYVGPNKNIDVNVFAGRIKSESGLGSFFLVRHPEENISFLENLQKELESLEKEALIAVSTVKLSTLDPKLINEIERVKEMVQQAEKPISPTTT